MTDKTTPGAEPFEYIELDQDFCTREYGIGACQAALAAAGFKCFNTRATCQDPDNYDRGSLTLRFCMNQQRLPKDGYYRPFLKSVNITPARLNPGGGNRNASALGERATLSFSCSDHPDPDRLVDPYLDSRDYDPMERGTFWTKWRARNPYYMFRPVRHVSGYLVDGVVVEKVTRTFFITHFSGPSPDGTVSFKAKDVLAMAANDKAKWPALSGGSLAGAIAAGDGSLTLSPAGIGDAEYPASGVGQIGKETVTFTRSGDNVTLTARGQYGTTAEDHDAGDVFQLCKDVTNAAPQDVLYNALTEGAGIDPVYLDKTQWDAEGVNYLPRRYERLICKPEGVADVVGQLTEQMYFTTWFDEREALVKIRALRPDQDDAITALDDERGLVRDQTSWEDLTDQLYTEVWVHHGLLVPSGDITDDTNYAATQKITSDSASDDKHRTRRIKEVFACWITAANGAAAIELGKKLLDRYREIPRRCSFSVDAKDSDLWLGDFVQIQNRQRTDAVGQDEPVNLQIYQAEETRVADRFRYTAQEFQFQQPIDPNERLIVISADMHNVNLRTLHDSIYAAPVGTENVTVIIQQGVRIGGAPAQSPILGVDYSSGFSTGLYFPGVHYTSSVNYYRVGRRGGVQFPVVMHSGLLIPIVSEPCQDSLFGDPVCPDQRDVGPDNLDYYSQPYSDAEGNFPYEVSPQGISVRVPKTVALRTGNWPSGVTLNLVVETGAKILGAGGASGAVPLVGRYDLSPEPEDGIGVRHIERGGDGGDAFQADYPISIANYGLIASGGGGGAGVHTGTGSNPNAIGYQLVVPGGGGAGFPVGPTTQILCDTIGTSSGCSSSAVQPAAGSESSGGRAGTYGSTVSGEGGGLAADGEQTNNSFSGGVNYAGKAGNAVADGKENITWTVRGDVRGAEA